MNPVLAHIAESVERLSPYQPGRPIAEVAAEQGIAQVIKLASNENPLGPGERALAAIRELTASDVGRYPDANGGRLRAAIAERLSIDAQCILLGNGSNDILELAAHLLLNEKTAAVYSQHAFIVYTLATLTRRAQPRVVAATDFAHDLDGLATAAQHEDVRLIFVANPNNPTGTWHPPDAIRRFLGRVRKDVLVVLDEAYCEYLHDGEQATLPLLQDYPNLLITRTFSKLHGLAGLRAGYGIGAAELIDRLNRIRQPFNLNAVAQITATAALNDEAHTRASRQNNEEGMAALTAALAQRNIRCIPSRANFLTFRPPDADALYNSLLATGIIVRRLGEYELPDWLRVSIGTPAENERFIRHLNDD